MELRPAGGGPARPINVQLIAEVGQLPDIGYFESEGDDRSPLGERELSPGVCKMPLFEDVRYKMHGEGYSTPTNTQSQTDSIEVDRADDHLTKIAFTFGSAGCGE